MRIALFAPYDLARDGGVTNQVRSQARALRQFGHEVLVYGPASAPLPEGEIAIGPSLSLTLSGTESGMALDPASAWRTVRLLKAERFDLLHVHEPLTPLVPWVALWSAAVPIVGTFHVYREHGHRLYSIGRPILRPLINRLAHRIAVSEAARRTVAQYFPGTYEIVPNGIDVAEFTAPRQRPPSLSTDHRHVLYIGRLEPRKGVEYLIRAMGQLQRALPDARLIVAGDGPERRRLTALAGECGTDVTFLGRVANPDLPAYIQASDLVCSPALGGESFGIVLLEAMACGRPVVASRIDGYVGLIGDVQCGTLVPPGDVDGLEHALRPLLQDAELRRTLGARGAAAAHAYDSLAIARRLDAIYRRVRPSV
ncbi:MAG: glycosyltransferase family 4 protein [Vicinamibacterales bacterium]